MDKFVRDVIVNVVANLVAAAVLYLAAVLAGALPQNDRLQLAASISIVGFLAGWGIATLARRLNQQRIVLIVFFVPAGAYVILKTTLFPTPGTPWLLGFGFCVAGGMILLVAVWIGLRYDIRGRHTPKSLGRSV
jgi:hypothetical protein